MRALGKGSFASLVKTGLTIASWFLWIVFVALVIGTSVYLAVLGLISAGLLDAAVLAEGGGSVRNGDAAYPNVRAGDWQVIIPALLSALVVVGGGIIIVGRLLKLFGSFTSGEPFRRENATHLRAIWITMLAVEILRLVLMGLAGGLFATVGPPDGTLARFELSFDFTTWMSIAILIVLAEVFREGARLKEEQELTI